MVPSSFVLVSASALDSLEGSAYRSEVIVRCVQSWRMTSMRLLALKGGIPCIHPSQRRCGSEEDFLGLEAPSAGIEHYAKEII